jgi:hypothetical protein
MPSASALGFQVLRPQDDHLEFVFRFATAFWSGR